MPTNPPSSSSPPHPPGEPPQRDVRATGAERRPLKCWARLASGCSRNGGKYGRAPTWRFSTSTIASAPSPAEMSGRPALMVALVLLGLTPNHRCRPASPDREPSRAGRGDRELLGLSHAPIVAASQVPTRLRSRRLGIRPRWPAPGRHLYALPYRPALRSAKDRHRRLRKLPRGRPSRSTGDGLRGLPQHHFVPKRRGACRPRQDELPAQGCPHAALVRELSSG